MTQSHFSVTPWIDTTLPRATRSSLYLAARTKLINAGYSAERYFQYRDGDTKAEATAKHDAETLATEILDKTGLVMKVQEGIFL